MIATRDEFVKASNERIHDFAKEAKEEIGPFTATAIRVELRAMFDMGLSKGRENEIPNNLPTA
jgi:hypothetical protein